MCSTRPGLKTTWVYPNCPALVETCSKAQCLLEPQPLLFWVQTGCSYKYHHGKNNRKSVPAAPSLPPLIKNPQQMGIKPASELLIATRSASSKSPSLPPLGWDRNLPLVWDFLHPEQPWSRSCAREHSQTRHVSLKPHLGREKGNKSQRKM